MTSPIAILAEKRAVIFDFDDTLVLSAKERWPALRRTAERFSVTITDDAISRVWGAPYRQMLASLVPSVSADAFTEAYLEVLKALPVALSPKVREFLESLTRRGVLMQILSANDSRVIAHDLSALGISMVFEAVVGCDESRYFKPDARALELPLALLGARGITSQEVIFVGDGWRDLETARSASVDFIAITTGLDSRESFIARGLPSNRIISSYAELIL